MRFYSRLAAITVIAVPSLVCAQQPASPPSASGGSDVAARVGDRVITVAEVDAAWRAADAAAQAQAVQAVYDGRRDALERLVGDILIEQAAKAKGIPADQFARAELAKRVTPVAAADVEAFYQQNASRMQGRPIEDVRDRIRAFLQQQREAAARAALVSELRKSGPAVSVTLDPPRQMVKVSADDPTRGAATASVVLVEYSDYQ